jgi:hypothetical protein
LLFATWSGLPLELSNPVQVAFLPELTAHKDKLLSGQERGTAVYAATFIRQRRIVLESGLLARPAALRFIFVHEVFHFVWSRLGNTRRNEYVRLVAQEVASNARGELGESSSVKKEELRGDSAISSSPAVWRDYACESFCDSAAFLFTGVVVHEGAKLGKTWIAFRRKWFEQNLRDERRWTV